jgi:hypothetical protein
VTSTSLKRLRNVSAVLLLGLAGCATESHQALEPPKPAAAATAGAYRGPRSTLMVGKFDNRSSYQKARSENRPVPPGFHAHLGYLYFQLGKLDQAQQELETEKAQFPESAVFMDRLLSNLRKN